MDCNNCLHIAVCGKYQATGGHVRNCKNFVEEKHGRWIADKKTGFCYCSECLVSGSPQWKRCPVCESKMDLPNITEETMDALKKMGEKVHGGNNGES